MARAYDVIVIGGGIMGTSSAFELAQRGQKVLVLEKSTVGAGPTGQSSAILRTHYSNELTTRMSLYGLEFYRSFREHTGDECSFRQTGFLVLAAEADRAGLEANVAIQRRVGISSEILAPEAVRELLPGLETRDLVTAAWEPASGYADPYLAVTLLARAARRHGVELLQDTEVTGVRLARGRVEGVDTTAGSFDAPQVLNTAGAWGARVARMAGVEVPINPCRVQVAFFRRPPGHEGFHPIVADFVNACYFRPEIGDQTLAGLIDPSEANAIVDPDDFPRKADFAFQADVGARLSRRYPALEASEITGGYASLYAITPDWHPVIDEVPSGSGFFVCSGFSGHGFKLGPAVGVMVADLVTGSSRPRFGASLFRLSRYQEGRPVRGEYEYGVVG